MPAVDPPDAAARAAAGRAAAAAGLAVDPERAVVLGATNNIVLRLDPRRVVAKVGRWRHSHDVLRREHRVATALATVGADTVRPWPGVDPMRDAASGCTVTLWELLDHGPPASEDALAAGLDGLHRALRDVESHLDAPSFLWGLDLAGETLAHDDAMAPMSSDDRTFLRGIFAELRERTEDATARAPVQLLHGEPHGNNVVSTPEGPRWIDFEATCVGPREWDLASVDEEVAARTAPHDRELLELLRDVNRARVAVWCWSGADRGDLRWHAEHHLGALRARYG